MGDVRGVAFDRTPSLTIYVPYWQRRTWGGLSLAVKTTVEPAAMASPIRNAIRRLDAELPVPQFRTMKIVNQSVAHRRFQRNLILIFALASLALASLGIYGVVSYSVAVRTNEIGIRVALGASTMEVLRMVLIQALVPVAGGLGCSLLASFALV